MKKIAVFPGSFDPFTKGHESIVNRSIDLFDEIIIAIGHNQNKKGYFSVEKRLEWIKELYKNNKKIKVDNFKGLTVDYCKKVNAKYILRGLRTASDFEYERAIAQTNKTLDKNIETIFILTTAELTPVHSAIIRDILKNGGNAQQFVPDGIKLQ